MTSTAAELPPERDATPDEAYELGRIAGYDEAMREVAPRVVSTVAELDALPEGSVVRCDDAEEIGMNIAERRRFGWVHVGADFEFTSAQMVDGGLAYTVLWVGGTE